MAKFKAGDKVRVTADAASLEEVGIYGPRGSRLPGAEGTVQSQAGAYYLVTFAEDLGGNWYLGPSQFEAVAVKVQKPKIARPTKVKPKTAKPAKVKPVKVGLASLADAIALYPQTRKVLVHLERHGSISPLEAFGVYRITRLAARIKEIRNAGFKVETNMKTDPTGTKYAEYRLSHV